MMRRGVGVSRNEHATNLSKRKCLSAHWIAPQAGRKSLRQKAGLGGSDTPRMRPLKSETSGEVRFVAVEPRPAQNAGLESQVEPPIK